MKKLFLFPLLWVSIFCLAQNVKLGYAGGNRESELLQNDPVSGKQHYKLVPFSMKAGQGAVFSITSNVFKPLIILSTASGQVIESGQSINADSSEVKVSFIASTDTSFAIILTSAEENKTGKFNYGIKILDSSQVIFKEDYSFCDRLGYLFNHWQMSWLVTPGKLQRGFHQPRGYTVPVAYDYYKPKYTLVKGRWAQITGNYEENMFSMPEQDKKEKEKEKEIIEFYNKICADIKSCIDANAWTIETEGWDLKNFGSVSPYSSTITHFIFKGSVKDQELKSFKVVLQPPVINLFDKSKVKEFKVHLIFN